MRTWLYCDSGRCGLGTVAETAKEESTLRILVPALEGDGNLTYPHRETWHTPAELPATRHVHSAPPGGASQEGTAYHSRPPFLSCGGVRMRFLDPSTMTKRCACLQQRSTLPASPLSLEMWVLLSPVGYVDPPVAPTPILVVTTVTCREGVEDAPWSTDAWKR